MEGSIKNFINSDCFIALMISYIVISKMKRGKVDKICSLAWNLDYFMLAIW